MKRSSVSAILAGALALMAALPAAGEVETTIAGSDPPGNNEVYPYVPSVRVTGEHADAILPGIKSLTSPLPGWPENHDPYQFCSGVWNGACETSWIKGDATGGEDPPSLATGTNFLQNWMGRLPDNLQFREMSIPGTHGSGTAGTNVFFENQEWNFLEQIRGGIRAFDPRPKDVYYEFKKIDLFNPDEDLLSTTGDLFSNALTLGETRFSLVPDLEQWNAESARLGSPLHMAIKADDTAATVRHGNIVQLAHSVYLDVSLAQMLVQMKTGISEQIDSNEEPTEALIIRAVAPTEQMNYFWSELCRGFCSELPWGSIENVTYEDPEASSVFGEPLKFTISRQYPDIHYIELWEGGEVDNDQAPTKWIEGPAPTGFGEAFRSAWRQYHDPIANFLRSKYPDGEGTVWKRDLRKVTDDGTGINVTERYDAPGLNCLTDILTPGRTVRLKEGHFTVLDVDCDSFVVANPDSLNPHYFYNSVISKWHDWALVPELGDYRGKALWLAGQSLNLSGTSRQDRFSVTFAGLGNCVGNPPGSGGNETIPPCSSLVNDTSFANVGGKYSAVKEYIDKAGYDRLYTDFTKTATAPVWTWNFSSGADNVTPVGLANVVNYELAEYLNTKPSHTNVGTIFMDYPAEGLLYRIIKTNFRYERLIEYDLQIDCSQDGTDEPIVVGFYYGTELLYYQVVWDPDCSGAFDERVNVRAVFPATPYLEDINTAAVDWENYPHLYRPMPFTHIEIRRVGGEFDPIYIDQVFLNKVEVGRSDAAPLEGEDSWADDVTVAAWGDEDGAYWATIAGSDAFADPGIADCWRFEVAGGTRFGGFLYPASDAHNAANRVYPCRDESSALKAQITEYKNKKNNTPDGEQTYSIHRQFYGDFYDDKNLNPIAKIKVASQNLDANGDLVFTFEADASESQLPRDAEYRWDLNGNGVFDVTGPIAGRVSSKQCGEVRLGVFVKREPQLQTAVPELGYPLLALDTFKLACERTELTVATTNNTVTVALQGLEEIGPLQWEFTSPEHGSLSGLPTGPLVNADVTYTLTSPDGQIVQEDVFTYILKDDLGSKRATGVVRVFKYRDTDGDGMPDECNFSTETAEICVDSGLVSDPDDDNDTIPDEEDAYPLVALGSLTDRNSNGAPDTCDATCLATGMQADKQLIAVDVFVATPKNTAVAVVLEGSDFERHELTYDIRSFRTDNNPGGDASTYYGTLNDAGNTVQWIGAVSGPVLTYTPATDFRGLDTFTYRVIEPRCSASPSTCYGAQESPIKTVTIDVYDANREVALLTGSDEFAGIAGADAAGTSVALSSDGQMMAIGVPDADGNGENSGLVRLYEWNAGTWSQLGADINGEAVGDAAGTSVALSSDGQTVAIGAPRHADSGRDSGQLRVYQWNGSSWVQMGASIDGYEWGEMLSSGYIYAGGDALGTSVALSSDGQTVAIGAPGNDGNGYNSGHVRVYQWDGNSWLQIGEDINGEVRTDLSGTSVALSSNGEIVAIGAPGNDGNGPNSGHVRIYQWGGNGWLQLGGDINGETDGDASGTSVALSSEGHTIAIGAPYNGLIAGHVRVYRWDAVAGVWTQQGEDIDGEYALGTSVALSNDGQTLSSGTPSSTVAPGYAQVYQWDGSEWIERVEAINGEDKISTVCDVSDPACFNVASGTSVALSGDGQIMAVGGRLDNSGGSGSGHVRVYQLNNHAPYIVNDFSTPTVLLTGADAPYSFSLAERFADVDPDTLTFSIENLPVWASFDTTTGQFTGTPGSQDAGFASDIVVSASDGQLTVSLYSFDVLVLLDTDGDGQPNEWTIDCDVSCQNNSGLTEDLNDDNDLFPDESDDFPLGENPLLFSLSPFLVEAGATLTIQGSGFTLVEGSVAVGEAVCPVNTWTETQITCTVPAGSGTNLLVRVTANGLPSDTLYVYYLPPNTTSISPDSGAAGSDITITGNHFGVTADTVTVGGVDCPVVSWADKQIVCTVPPGAGLAQEVRLTAGGQVSDPVSAPVTFNYAAPVAASLSPSVAAASTTLSIFGDHFGPAAGSVTLGGVDCPLVSWSNTQISCTVPPGAGAEQLVQVTAGGQQSGSLLFSYPTPVITGLSPRFIDFDRVGFATTATVTADSPTGIGDVTANVGDSPTVPGYSSLSLTKSGYYSDDDGTLGISAGDTINYVFLVTNTGKTTLTNIQVTDPSSPVQWAVISSLAPGATHITSQVASYTLTQSDIDSSSQMFLAAGDSLTISGTNFGPTPGSVTLSGTVCPIRSWSNTQISCTVPAGFGTNNPIQVNAGGQLSNTINFDYTYPDSDNDSLFDIDEQTGFRGETISFSTGQQATDVHAADVDGDGDADVIAAWSSENKVAWFENLGDGEFGAAQIITTGAMGVRSIYSADIDDDGYVDVLSASADDNTIAWYQNSSSSPGSFAAGQVISATECGANTVRAADLNNDGRVDVLSTSWSVSGCFEDGKVSWYENLGNGVFGAEQVVYSINQPSDIDTGDLDGDGDIDVVVTPSGKSCGACRIFPIINPTISVNPAYTDFIAIAAGQSNDIPGQLSVAFNDFDGDGDLDVVVAAEFNQGKIVLYKNDGLYADGLPIFDDYVYEIGTFPATSSVSLTTADIDGDGDEDVLLTSESADRIAWIENTGGLTFGAQHLITSSADGVVAVDVADLDGDGDLDVLSAGAVDGRILWLENLGVRTSPDDSDSDDDGVDDGVDLYPLSPVTTTDTDGDGAPDVCDSTCVAAGMMADPDDDNDGVLDGDDAFPFDATESVDTDADGIGDNADAFPSISLGDLTDTDNDGRPDDCAELSPSPCDSTAMVSDTDDDNDGVLDVNDAFPLISLDGLSDFDGDGAADVVDNCRTVANPTQTNTDGLADGGDACDTDDDGDGQLDVDDAEPTSPSKDGLRYLFNGDGSLRLTGCVTEDSICSTFNGVVDIPAALILDGQSFPVTIIGGQNLNAFTFLHLSAVTIPDGIEIIEASAFLGDVNDGTSVTGRFTTLALPASLTTIGNQAFSYAFDNSRPGVVTFMGDRPAIAEDAFRGNTGLVQINYCGGGTGWPGSPISISQQGEPEVALTPVASCDSDADGVLDIDDAFPLISLGGLTDTDNDGRPDDCDTACVDLGMAADTDDDNDGMPDDYEAIYGLDPFDGSDAAEDVDGDGISNLGEYELGSDPRSSLSPASEGSGSVSFPAVTHLGSLKLNIPSGASVGETVYLRLDWHNVRFDQSPVLHTPSNYIVNGGENSNTVVYQWTPEVAVAPGEGVWVQIGGITIPEEDCVVLTTSIFDSLSDALAKTNPTHRRASSFRFDGVPYQCSVE